MPQPMSLHAPLAAAAAVALAALAAPAFAAPGVRVENAAARLIVIPEARSDVSVSVHAGDSRLPVPQARRAGDRIVVDGGLRDRVEGCGAVNINIMGVVHHRAGDPAPGQRVHIRGLGQVPLSALPVITARVPMDASVSAADAVFGEVGPTERLRLAKAGCGDFRVGDVRGDFDLSSSGSGDTAAGRVGRLRAALSGSGDLIGSDVGGDVDVKISGSSDVKLGRVAGGMAVAVSGSGDVHAVEANGALNARIAGSGDVTVDGGRAASVAAQIAGSGDFRFGGEAGALSAQIAGSGDIRVARVTGPVAKSVHGSGDVVIGR